MPMPPVDELWFGLSLALGIGLLIGAERERRKGEGPARSAAGIRTFAIVALLGAVSIVLGGNLLHAVAAFGVALLAAIAYFRSLEQDPGLTTVSSGSDSLADLIHLRYCFSWRPRRTRQAHPSSGCCKEGIKKKPWRLTLYA
ncbi:MAG: MgtC/SapB family protein [Burkholderiales bacterium]|nr:MgtC/SapB family protein [Burkholderiales bacterium]